jgi:threonine/homoserine/homoserine lactone efflux protein
MISWWLFIPACFALNMAPGPNNLTAFMNGASKPLPSALIAGLGRLPAFAFLIGLTAVGLGIVLSASVYAFTVIKLLGAAYLVYIGIRMWRAAPPDLSGIDVGRPVRELARQDFMVAISNPKAIAIFTAFFPQFIKPGDDVTASILMMGGAFLVMEAVAMVIYALLGRGLRGTISRFGGFRLLNKGVGGFMVFSGLSLAVSRH